MNSEELATAVPPIGIFLSYYEKYAISSLERFYKFLTALHPEAIVLVVCNGPSAINFRRERVIFVTGRNELREFSGWDAGIDYARSRGLLLDSRPIIFANDTFCQHNKFGPITRHAFMKAFRQVIRPTSGLRIAGEAWSIGAPFRVDRFIASQWIATYLFAISGDLMRQIGALSPPPPMSRFYAAGEDVFDFSDQLSTNLAMHIKSWLRGDSGATWKNHAGADSQELASLRGKANSIISEKYVSALVVSMGGQIDDVFERPLVRRLRRLETLWSRLRHVLPSLA
jgi:hypothetical protein